MLPKLTMMARLTADPELRYLQDGKAVCNINLACSEKYGEKETQLFIDATAFGKTAEFLNNVTKGQRVYVSGKIKTDQWMDQNNQKRSKICMVVESFEYVEKRDNQQQGGYQQQQQPQSYTQGTNGQQIPVYQENVQQQPMQQQYQQQQMPPQQPQIDIDENSIPF